MNDSSAGGTFVRNSHCCERGECPAEMGMHQAVNKNQSSS